jgi:alanine racemase
MSNLAPNSKTIAVIEVNAYGQGAVEVVKNLQTMVPAFTLAFIDEHN